MRTRDENLETIQAMTGADPDRDAAVDEAVMTQLGMDALSDEAVALMAQEYLRLALIANPVRFAGRH